MGKRRKEKLTDEQIDKLKEAGFKWYEISHFKAGRTEKISKDKYKEMRTLVYPRKPRESRPILITNKGIRIRKSKQIIFL